MVKTIKRVGILFLALSTLLLVAVAPTQASGFPDLGGVPWATQAVDLLAGQGVLRGFPDGLFHPNQSVSYQEIIAMTFSMMYMQNEAESMQSSPPVGDESSWAHGYVALAESKGLFGPSPNPVPTPASFQAPASRVWVADFLTAALGYSQWQWSYRHRLSFQDLSGIPANARMMLETAFNQGIATGDGTSFFHPNDPVTRAQAAIMVLHAEKRIQGVAAPSLPLVTPYDAGPLEDLVFVIGPEIITPGLQNDLTTNASSISDVGFTDYYFLQGVNQNQWFAERHSLDLNSPLFESDFSDTSSCAQQTLSLTQTQGEHSFMVVDNYLVKQAQFSPSLAHQVLSGSANRALLVNEIMSFIKRDGESGAVVDFERLCYEDKVPFEEFLSALATSLHSAGLKLIVAVPPEISTDPTNIITRPFDYRWIGKVADEVYLMTYDLHAPWGTPGPLASGDWLKAVLKYAVTTIPRQKLLLGIAGYGYVWPPQNGLTAYDGALDHEAIDSLLNKYNGTAQYDQKLHSPSITYTDQSGTTHVIWYENERSYAYKLGLVRRYGLAGFGLWYLGSEGSGYWQAINQAGVKVK